MAESGDRIGPYVLASPLGAGAMGEVWRAHDERLDREVALKLLPADMAEDPERRARLLREAKASAGIGHPNVVTLYDVVSEHGRDVLVMELVEGRTLSQVVRGNSATLEDALGYVEAIASALDAAHAKGTLHRDMKLSNVMLSDAGVIKVLDFGLAKLKQADDSDAAHDDKTLVPIRAPKDEPKDAPRAVALQATIATIAQPLGAASGEPADVGLDETMPSQPAALSQSGDMLETRAGSLMGTPMYMAPELLGGQRPSERSEIYAVGIIAFELVSGSSPFTAKGIEGLFQQILQRDITALPEYVPPSVRALIEKAIAKSPAARFQSMAQMQTAVQAARDELFGVRRRPRWPFALAAALVAAIGAAAIVYVATRPDKPAPVRPGDKYVAHALEEYDVFFNQKALSSLRAAIKHDPDNPRAHAYMLLFGQAKDTERRRALDSAERVLAALPSKLVKDRALLAAAIALEKRGPPAAQKSLLASGADLKTDTELAFWSAELAYRAHDYATADRGFRALLTKPDNSFRGRIYDHFSSVLLYFDKVDEAVKIGKAYRDAFPGEADAVGVYATTLAAAGRFDQALALAKEALDLNEGEDTLAGLAKVHAYRGELRKARALYRRSMHRAGDKRRVMRRAALGLLYLIDEQVDEAQKIVAPCLPGGEDAAITTRGACLWVAGLAMPERIDEAITALIALAKGGTELAPAYGAPAHLAGLLRARKLFRGGGCALPPESTKDGTDIAPTVAAKARQLCENATDFYAAYHVPFYSTYALCEKAALARQTGDPRGAEKLLAPIAEAAPGRGLLLLELARTRARLNRPAAVATLDRLSQEWPALDADSKVRQRIHVVRKTALTP